MEKPITTIVCAALAGLSLWASSPVARAAPFPERPINFIVPFAAGGATDIVARTVAAKMSEDIGQRVVVENRSGASGNIGTLAAARAAPDGYTLVLATTTQLIDHYLSKALSYDLFTDLVPVALLADAPEIFVVNSALNVNTLAEFAEAARKAQGGFNYGTPGTGSVPHLGGELLARTIKANLVHVPFQGTSEAMKEVATGSVQLSIATQASAAAFTQSGMVKLIAIAAPHRLSTLPDVPTTMESGYPALQLSNWFGVMAPKGTSPELVAKINAMFNMALADPAVTSAILKQGIEPLHRTPEQFAERLAADGKSYKAILDEIGLVGSK
jgi:tripartite-type tricarboxylate transporter receptor subunit TctC